MTTTIWTEQTRFIFRARRERTFDLSMTTSVVKPPRRALEERGPLQNISTRFPRVARQKRLLAPRVHGGRREQRRVHVFVRARGGVVRSRQLLRLGLEPLVADLVAPVPLAPLRASLQAPRSRAGRRVRSFPIRAFRAFFALFAAFFAASSARVARIASSSSPFGLIGHPRLVRERVLGTEHVVHRGLRLAQRAVAHHEPARREREEFGLAVDRPARRPGHENVASTANRKEDRVYVRLVVPKAAVVRNPRRRGGA